MRIPPFPRWDRAAIAALILLMAGQSIALVHKERQPPPFLITSLGAASTSFVTTGMSLDGLQTVEREGATDVIRASRETGHATVLMAFSETCAHAQEVSARWAEWMSVRASDSRLRLVPVSGDAPEDAARFASAAGWAVPPTSLRITDLQSREVQVINRTPWVFLLDARGQVVYEGHGAELERLDQAIEAHLTETGGGTPGGAIAQSPANFELGG
jgi:hypothetical protein